MSSSSKYNRDILELCFTFLTFRELLNIIPVCKLWKEILATSKVCFKKFIRSLDASTSEKEKESFNKYYLSSPYFPALGSMAFVFDYRNLDGEIVFNNFKYCLEKWASNLIYLEISIVPKDELYPESPTISNNEMVSFFQSFHLPLLQNLVVQVNSTRECRIEPLLVKFKELKMLKLFNHRTAIADNSFKLDSLKYLEFSYSSLTYLCLNNIILMEKQDLTFITNCTQLRKLFLSLKLSSFPKEIVPCSSFPIELFPAHQFTYLDKLALAGGAIYLLPAFSSYFYKGEKQIYSSLNELSLFLNGKSEWEEKENDVFMDILKDKSFSKIRSLRLGNISGSFAAEKLLGGEPFLFLEVLNISNSIFRKKKFLQYLNPYYFNNLKELNLVYTFNMKMDTSLYPLENFISLQTLKLTEYYLSRAELKVISHLPNLKRLEFDCCKGIEPRIKLLKPLKQKLLNFTYLGEKLTEKDKKILSEFDHFSSFEIQEY